MIEALFFYAFAAVLVISSLLVVTARNPVHAVLFLILAFFNAAGLFVILGAEFVAMTLVIVYVGAVAVLFLFVVMMLDIHFKNIKRHLPLAGFVGLALLAELLILYHKWQSHPAAASRISAPVPDNMTNTHALGSLLYTQYMYPFQLAGLVLLVAMVGAITLTLRERSGVRRQSVAEQVSRSAKDVLKIVKVKTGEGVE